MTDGSGSSETGRGPRGAAGRVIGEAEVQEARRRGADRVVVTGEDLITAQARDSAERLGIRFMRGPLEQPAVAAVDGPKAMRRALYRHNPRWVTPGVPTGADPGSFGRVAFVGAGGVGVNTALLAAAGSIAEELILIDIVPGSAAATALDLEHASGITRSASRVIGGTDVTMVADADVVVISAGRPRAPGMSRAELVGGNGRVVRSVAEAVAAHAPQAIVVVITNPLDEMTMEFYTESGFERERVLGMAGTLDSARFRRALADAAGVPVGDVSAFTLGSHGAEMVPIVSQATIQGRPLSAWLSPEEIAACVATTVGGGGDVVALRRTGSATIAPAYATYEVLDALRGGRPDAIPVSVVLGGEYGISDIVAGVPALLGRSGVLDIVELPLTDGELDALRQAADAVAGRIAEGRGRPIPG